MYAYVYICMHFFQIHMHIYLYRNIVASNIHLDLYTHIFRDTFMYIYTHLHTFTYKKHCVYIIIYIYTHTHAVHIDMFTYIYCIPYPKTQVCRLLSLHSSNAKSVDWYLSSWVNFTIFYDLPTRNFCSVSFLTTFLHAECKMPNTYLYMYIPVVHHFFSPPSFLGCINYPNLEVLRWVYRIVAM